MLVEHVILICQFTQYYEIIPYSGTLRSLSIYASRS